MKIFKRTRPEKPHFLHLQIFRFHTLQRITYELRHYPRSSPSIKINQISLNHSELSLLQLFCLEKFLKRKTQSSNKNQSGTKQPLNNIKISKPVLLPQFPKTINHPFKFLIIVDTLLPKMLIKVDIFIDSLSRSCQKTRDCTRKSPAGKWMYVYAIRRNNIRFVINTRIGLSSSVISNKRCICNTVYSTFTGVLLLPVPADGS